MESKAEKKYVTHTIDRMIHRFMYQPNMVYILTSSLLHNDTNVSIASLLL